MNTKIKGYYTCEEAAEKLGLTLTRIHQFTQVGRLDFIPIGGAYLIPAEELERFASIPRKPGPRPEGGVHV